VIMSLNEIAATAAKAVRGRGHPEGIAEEMGFAVRWLCERELPGVAMLLSALDKRSMAEAAVIPVIDRADGVIRLRSTGGDPLPALRVAPSMAELAAVELDWTDGTSADGSSPRSLEVDSLTHPLLLVPLVARHGSSRLAARWSTPDGPVAMDRSGDGLRIRAGSASALGAGVGHDVILGVAPDGRNGPPDVMTSAELEAASQRSLTSGCAVDTADWDRLARWARRTYVPVSEESRLRGAGAGLTDND